MIQPPNLPLAPKAYEPRYHDQIARLLTLFFNRITRIGPFTATTLTLIDLVGANRLANNITNVQTTIPLVDASKFPTAGSGTIVGTAGSEKFSWTGKSGDTLTGVTRGILGTTAIHHNQHDIVVASATPGTVYAHPITNALYVVM